MILTKKLTREERTSSELKQANKIRHLLTYVPAVSLPQVFFYDLLHSDFKQSYNIYSISIFSIFHRLVKELWSCGCLESWFWLLTPLKVPLYFILMGIPGFEVFHTWISILFCCLYTISIVGNSIILAVIRAEPSLHERMYLFLSMLALTDLGLTLTTWPIVVGILWFNASWISFEACFAQFFLINSPLWNLLCCWPCPLTTKWPFTTPSIIFPSSSGGQSEE